MADPDIPAALRGQNLQGITLLDIAPTVLERLGIKPPADMLGRVIATMEGEGATAKGER